MRDAREIANFLLDHADSVGVPLTNMALLKVLYYAQGWYFREKQKPLLANKFEAWNHGPVIRVIYDAFKTYGDQPITGRAQRFSVAANRYIEARGNIEPELADFLISKVFNFYATKSAFLLSHMTHEKNAPWDIIFTKVQKEICLRAEIPNELISNHFSATAN